MGHWAVGGLLLQLATFNSMEYLLHICIYRLPVYSTSGLFGEEGEEGVGITINVHNVYEQ